MALHDSFPDRKARNNMSSVLFSSLLGAIVVIIYPVIVTVIYADTEKASRRRDRLRVWQLVTLVCTTMLAGWTHFWVQPYGTQLLIAETPLWAAVAFGVSLSIGLGLAVTWFDRRHHTAQVRLAQMILRP